MTKETPYRLGRHHGRSRAFSLLEVLISITILSLLLVILLNLVNGATTLWRQSENRVDSYREGRAALNLIATDLGNLVALRNPDLFALDTVAGLPPNAETPPDASHIFFLSALPSDSQEATESKSDVCVVGYFLAYDKATKNAERRSMNLYRYFLSSDSAYDSAITAGNLVPTTPSTDPTTGAELVARNVIGFKVHAFTTTSDGTRTPFTTASATTPLPNTLSLEITALNNEVAKRLPDTRAAWRDKNQALIKQNSRTFTTRVRLRADAPIGPDPTPP